MPEPKWDVYPNFGRDEFVCKCGCGRADMDPLFVSKLQSIRTDTGLPMTITSGYRCPEHNQMVSSSGKDGPHTTGKAADISCRGETALAFLKAALEHRFQGIGVQQKGGGRFIHLDMVQRPYGRALWSY